MQFYVNLNEKSIYFRDLKRGQWSITWDRAYLGRTGSTCTQQWRGGRRRCTYWAHILCYLKPLPPNPTWDGQAWSISWTKFYPSVDLLIKYMFILLTKFYLSASNFSQGSRELCRSECFSPWTSPCLSLGTCILFSRKSTSWSRKLVVANQFYSGKS